MNIRNIGIAITGAAHSGQLAQLEQELAYYVECGFGLVEINPAPFHVIVHGELRRPQLQNLLAVLANFDLRYTIHGVDRLNLAYDSRHELCCQIMRCQFEICRAVGASRLVYHSGLQALEDVRIGLRSALPSDEELVEGARREAAAFRELAPIAADAGVTIGIENTDPHQWEHDLLARFDRPQSELAKYNARLQIPPIVRQLEAINHPNVALTLDFAHLHLAAHDLGFDFLTAVREAAPWTRHLHANDNFGHLDRGYEEERDRIAFGEGDIHLPPGWGAIPYRGALALLPDYDGDLILEIKPSLRDYFGEARQNMQDILGSLGRLEN